MACFVYNPEYTSEKKQRRKEEIENPEIKLCVILKNVSPEETEEEITETLGEMEYNVVKAERFKHLPMFEECWKKRRSELVTRWHLVKHSTNIEADRTLSSVGIVSN